MDHYDEILRDLLAWGRDIKGFKPAHATDGFAVASVAIEGMKNRDGTMIRGIGFKSRQASFAFALEMTVLFWLDDCFDEHLLAPHELDAVGAVIATGSTLPVTPEAQACRILLQVLAEQAQSDADYRLWMDGGAAYYRAWQREALLSSGQMEMSYAEYLENGIDSVDMPRIWATVSALWGWNMPVRVADPRFMRSLRHMAIACRLKNDLYSLEKERLEGCRANAVLLIERFLPSDAARAFIEEELRGYERLLDEDIEHLDQDDSFRCLTEILMAVNERFSTTPRDRYQSTAA